MQVRYMSRPEAKRRIAYANPPLRRIERARKTARVAVEETAVVTGEATSRLAHVDMLRVALTVGVICTHAVISYGGPGSWFYHAGDLPAGVRTAVSIPIAFGALFGMGAFFFVAGAFLPRSLERKGTRRFLAERWVRLGWPPLVFVLLVVPLVDLTVRAVAGPSEPAARILARQLRDLDAGPLWFVWVLLVLSAVAALALARLPRATPRDLRPQLLVRCAAFVVVVSFTLRIFFRIDSYQVGAAHVWQWGQCIGLFTLGVAAGRQGWLTRIPRGIRFACRWLMAAGLLAVVAVLVAAGDDLDPFGGGLHWQSLVIAVLEGGVSVSTTIVLVDLFRGAGGGRFAALLGRGAYGAYLLQTPILVGLALALREVAAPSGVKLLVVLPTAVALSFGAALLLRRVPGLRRAL